jgi:hypothetical protein
MPFPFVNGDVLSAADLNAYAGLVLVKTQTIGTAVSSVTVSDAFSATFDNYFITLSGGAGSTASGLNLTLGATTTGYYRGGIFMNFGSTSMGGVADTNVSSYFAAGVAETTNLSMKLHVFTPNAAARTLFVSEAMRASAGGLHTWYRGYLDDTTSYTAFTLTPSGGTITGGTIRVYGYNNG